MSAITSLVRKFSQAKNRDLIQIVLTAFGLLVVFLSLGTDGHFEFPGAVSFSQVESRLLSSKSFPVYKSYTDSDDILDDYPSYLEFILDVGQQVDSSKARLLQTKYTELRKQNPELAARFLKGLRFELVQKMELEGISEKRVSSSSPWLRKWVQKYISAWVQETDEYLFRTMAMKAMKKRKAE